MKFSDNIIRESLDEVFVIRTEEEMRKREEYNSRFWEIKKNNIVSVASGIPTHLYKTVARYLKIGESIYNNTGKFVAYRSS